MGEPGTAGAEEENYPHPEPPHLELVEGRRMSPPESAPPFLGVERSVTGRRWRARLADDRMALMLAQKLGVPEIVARLLASRGITAETADGFLSPRLRDL